MGDLRTLLVVVLSVEGVLLVLLLGTLAVATAQRRRWRRRHGRDLGRLEPLMRGYLLDGDREAEVVGAFTRLPWRSQVALVVRISVTLTGSGRARLRELARAGGLEVRCEGWAEHRRWPARLRAARLATLTGGGRPTIPDLLGDRHPEIRAEAAAWIAEHGDAEDVASLLEHLDGDEQLGRFVVTDRLARAGAKASAPIRRFLEDGQPEDPLPALQVATYLGEPGFVPIATRYLEHRSGEVRAAAASLIGSVGDAQAGGRLLAALDDPDERVRAEAAEWLGRLAHQPAASALARCLEDEAWVVRRAAGLALRALGPAGVLYLRRATRAADRFAADMATMVLQLPVRVG